MSRTIAVEHDGQTYYGRIGRVQGTFIGEEDHGIFAVNIDFAGPGWSQGTGCRGLGLHEKSGYGIDLIWQLIRVIGARSWEDLYSKEVVLLYTEEHSRGMVVGLANSTDEDLVLIFQEHYLQWKGGNK